MAFGKSFSFVDVSLAVVSMAAPCLLYVDIMVSCVVVIFVFVCVKEHPTRLTGSCCVMGNYGSVSALGNVRLSFVCPVVAVQQ